MSLFLTSRRMASHSSELEVLKEFLAIKIEQLQMRTRELLNQKEDLEAMHNSSAEVKEHLLNQLNDMKKEFTLKNTELLMKSQRLQELEQFEEVEMQRRETEKSELKQFKKDVQRELKALRKESATLKDQNTKYKKTLDALKMYLDKLMMPEDAQNALNMSGIEQPETIEEAKSEQM